MLSPTPERSSTPSPLPGTSVPHTIVQRPEGTTPSIHLGVQALISESQQHKQKRRRTVSPTTTEQQLLDMTQPPNIPRQEDEMYYFALSLVPKLN